MNISRREFARKIGMFVMMALAVGTSTLLGGCNAVTDLENWIPVALNALNGIKNLLGPTIPASVQPIITLIQAGFAALLSTIENYKSGKSTLADIENAISAIESGFQSFFAALNIPPALLATIEGLAQIILSTIEGFANQIQPTPATGAVAARKPLTVGGHVVPVAPKKRSIRQFKTDWNQLCAQHPEAKL